MGIPEIIEISLVFLTISLILYTCIVVFYRDVLSPKYDALYHYMVNCSRLPEYYFTPSAHINSNVRFKKLYNLFVKYRNHWCLIFFKKDINDFIDFYEKASDLTNSISSSLDLNEYCEHSKYEIFNKKAIELEELEESLISRGFVKYVRKKYNDKLIKYKEKKSGCHFYRHNLENLVKYYNSEFVKMELSEYENFFDNVLNYPLDQQQREAIVKAEDNCLVISSAGSGKTSTSIAKVKYLLTTERLRKDQILVLSYNRKTAEEFKNRLGYRDLDCKTFHSLALSIIGHVEESKPDVCDKTFLVECFYNLVRKSPTFKDNITKFYGELSSLTKSEHRYKDAEQYYKDRATYGIVAPYGDMDGRMIHTRSEEEKKICTWLTTHSIKFRYEQVYPIDTSSSGRRQYKPDFTIYYTKDGKQKVLYLEHFGIDINGNVPSWFGNNGSGGFYEANRRYHEEIVWKRRLHESNNTDLIETNSAMFHNGSVWLVLHTKLVQFGIIPRELTVDERFELLIERNKSMEENIITLFSSFITLMKSNGKTFNDIKSLIEESGQPKDFCERNNFLMFNLIEPLYKEYQEALSKRGQMDFVDLILHATKLCNEGKFVSPYSYIIVDEFQDISVDRYKFILSLRNKSPFTKTFCVGDDWQSIYRFSGSDMNLFSKFENYFGYTERCKIETTYRFGNPLVERSSKFILKNPIQVEKEIHPFSNNLFTNLLFVPFSRNDSNSYLNTISDLLDQIPRNESILLLGRYNYEKGVFPKNCIIDEDEIGKRATIKFSNRKIPFMSVHSAKGLEADNVIILNCSQDGGGFPSRVSDDPILGYVLSEIDDFEYSEERRLFYVAITRAKKCTYVLYNERMPSVFVTEMDLDSVKEENTICPLCKRGRIKLVKEGTSVHGNHYRSYNCSNSVAGCMYYTTDFDNDNNTADIDALLKGTGLTPTDSNSELSFQIPEPPAPNPTPSSDKYTFPDYGDLPF